MTAVVSRVLSHKMPCDMSEVVVQLAKQAYDADMRAKADEEIAMYVPKYLIIDRNACITRKDFVTALNYYMTLHGLPAYDIHDRALFRLLSGRYGLTLERPRCGRGNDVYVYGARFNYDATASRLNSF